MHKTGSTSSALRGVATAKVLRCTGCACVGVFRVRLRSAERAEYLWDVALVFDLEDGGPCDGAQRLHPAYIV